VVGFSGVNVLLVPFAPLEGMRRGCRALVTAIAGAVRPSAVWLGRVVNALDEPIDSKGALHSGLRPIRSATHHRWHMRDAGSAPRSVSACAPSILGHLLPRPAHRRFLRFTASADRCCCRCWRATYRADVIGLIGERGREVREFLQDDLGGAGLAGS
jgi:flagellum-specific ATP synthase